MKIDHTLQMAAMLAALALGPQLAAQTESTGTELRVMVQPADATVTCDGLLRAAPPLVLTDLEPGTHLLIAAKPGFREVRQTVELGPGQRAAVDLRLDPLRGLVLVHSTPAGADVEVSGAARGKTPLLIHDLPVGDYRLRLTTPGYLPKEVDLHVPDRAPRIVDVELLSSSASLALESTPTGAKVIINGIDKGRTPCLLDRLASGETIIELALPGYQSYRQPIKLEAGRPEQITVVLTPIPAKLSIVSMPPGARIYVDNQFRGEAPVLLEDLKPGSYRLRAELDGHDGQARTVELSMAQDLVEEFRLESNTGSIQITTEPADVQVFIDGEEAGTTSAAEPAALVSSPLRIDGLAIGSRQIQLVRKGYFPVAFEVEILRAQSTPVRHALKRRFIPNYEVRTATEVHKGVFVEQDPQGNIRIEVRPGIIKTISADEIESAERIPEE